MNSKQFNANGERAGQEVITKSLVSECRVNIEPIFEPINSNAQPLIQNPSFPQVSNDPIAIITQPKRSNATQKPRTTRTVDLRANALRANISTKQQPNRALSILQSRERLPLRTSLNLRADALRENTSNKQEPVRTISNLQAQEPRTTRTVLLRANALRAKTSNKPELEAKANAALIGLASSTGSTSWSESDLSANIQQVQVESPKIQIIRNSANTTLIHSLSGQTKDAAQLTENVAQLTENVAQLTEIETLPNRNEQSKPEEIKETAVTIEPKQETRIDFETDSKTDSHIDFHIDSHTEPHVFCEIEPRNSQQTKSKPSRSFFCAIFYSLLFWKPTEKGLKIMVGRWIPFRNFKEALEKSRAKIEPLSD